MIRVAEWTDGAAWDGFVTAAADSTVMHRHGWRAVVERTYGLRAFCLGAVDGEALRGVLPLVLLDSRLAGRNLVSMPFMDYGGACADGDEKAERALVEAALELAGRERAVLALRYFHRPHLELPVSHEKVTLLLELGEDEDTLWRRLPSERRNRIRKALKHGLTTTFHGEEGVGDFYRVWSTNMRDLGTPVHPARFFREMMRALPDATRLVLVRAGDRPIGAALMLRHRGMISIPWISSLRAFFDRSPNAVLYWEAMRFGVAHGDRLLDFGRSVPGSGTFEAKRQWGARPVPLDWYHHPESAEPPHVSIRRLGWAVRLWRWLPVPVANRIGPWVRRGMAN